MRHSWHDEQHKAPGFKKLGRYVLFDSKANLNIDFMYQL